MAGWLKQGLNTLGEGISTLTKEILAEEPPDHQGRSSHASPATTADHTPQKNGFESLGSRAEIERLRSLVSDMEERASRAESLASSKHNQMVQEYDKITAALREQIASLENRLSSTDHGLVPDTTGLSVSQVNGDPEIFRDVDLFSTSPDVFPVLELSKSQSSAPQNPGSPSDERHRHLSHKDSSADSDLLEALEHELKEKDSTIRHLTQEIARSKAAIAEFESVLPVVKSDAEIQTAEDVTSLGILLSGSDQSVQSDDNLLSDTQRESGVDASTMCELQCSVNEEGVQVNLGETGEFSPTESQQLKVSETSVAKVQNETEEADRQVVSTVETGIQFESENLDSHSQTDSLPKSTPDISEKAIQHDSETTTYDQETQYDLNLENPGLAQTDIQNETSEATVQTAELCTASRETQSAAAEVTDNGNQSEISGDVTLFQDYARIVEETQELHSQLGTLSSKHDRSLKEVERLRAHLLQVEQAFALDFQLAQQREEDLRELVQQLESQFASSAASDQSASQEVQEQVTLLHKEVCVLTEARDLVVSKLHEAEKKNADLESSLSKLRLASEHIKLEHRADLEQERDKARKSCRSLENQVRELSGANSALELKLAELDKNLQTSSRAVAEADTIRRQYAELRSQLEETSRLLATAQNEAASVGKARVDIALMKNMLMGYLIGPKNCQPDILRMMMVTLNFDEGERQKVQTNQTSTLRALFSSMSAEKGGHDPDNSFSNMLVKFIEQESRPKTAVNGVADFPREPPPKSSAVGPPNTRPLNTQRSYTMAASATGRPNTATDPSMAQDRMLEDILNGPSDTSSRSGPAVDIV